LENAGDVLVTNIGESVIDAALAPFAENDTTTLYPTEPPPSYATAMESPADLSVADVPLGDPLKTKCACPLPPDSCNPTRTGFAYGSFAPFVIGALPKSTGFNANA
jgi:hypothetical protein